MKRGLAKTSTREGEGAFSYPLGGERGTREELILPQAPEPKGAGGRADPSRPEEKTDFRLSRAPQRWSEEEKYDEMASYGKTPLGGRGDRSKRKQEGGKLDRASDAGELSLIEKEAIEEKNKKKNTTE